MNYKKLWLIWIIALSIFIIVVLLPSTFLLNEEIARNISVGYMIVTLIVGIGGWIHFRIEWKKIKKGTKRILTSEKIQYYGIDPKIENSEMIARKKKIFIFEITMILMLFIILLSSIHVFI